MAAGARSWETSDLGTAAYVHMKGLKLLGAQRRNESAQSVFRFEDPDDLGGDLEVEYINSECRRFDAAVRSLKKLGRDGRRRHR